MLISLYDTSFSFEGLDFCLSINLVCPHCEEQALFEVSRKIRHELDCNNCSGHFSTLLATARSKRSRGQKNTNSRNYTIRAFVEGREELLEFESNTYDEVELRSKDEFALSFVDEQPIILQNLNVAKYWVLNTSPEETSFPHIFAALVLIGVLIAIGFASS